MNRPSYPILEVKLSKNEAVDAIPGALIMMNWNFEIKTKSKGSLRSLAGGDSLFC